MSIAADLYRHVLAWKGAVFLRQLSSLALRHRPDLKPRLEELLSVDVRLSTLALRGPGRERRDAWEKEVARLSRQKESIERNLASLSAEFGQQQSLLDPKPEELQRVLPNGTALVDVLEYWHFLPSSPKRGGIPPRAEAGRLRREARPAHRPGRTGARNARRQGNGKLRSALLHDGGGAEIIADSPKVAAENSPQNFLKQAVWSPLQKSLEGARIVLVSPDGVLNRIPFAALPGAKPGSYLLEEIELATVPVPRLLLQKDQGAGLKNESEKPDRQSLLIVGDVDYGGSPGKAEGVQVADVRSAVRRSGALQFAALDSTRSEMATIRDSFEKDFPNGKVTPLRGRRATESEFRLEAPKYRWLHLATHGFFAPPEIVSALAQKRGSGTRLNEFTRNGISGCHPGLLSGIALSGANTPANEGQDDGILTAVEVAGLDLEKADLVVLSACETGLGAAAGGEGVLGLQRAFQLAGAKTTITSLWKIPDRATMQLMQRFYENLWDEKMSKLDALREAQLWMLKEGRQRGLDLEDNGVKQRNSKTPPAPLLGGLRPLRRLEVGKRREG